MYFSPFSVGDRFKMTIKVTGITDFGTQLIIGGNSNQYIQTIDKDGIYDIDYTCTNTYSDSLIGFNIPKLGECNIIIEEIPDYKGALVGDGVDDYGICENFPLFDNFTIVSIRKYINIPPLKNSGFLGFISPNDRLLVENYNFSQGDPRGMYYMNFGNDPRIGNSYKKNWLVCSTNTYQGGYYPKGEGKPFRKTFEMDLFNTFTKTRFGNIALYALEIYNRDLTDNREIKRVKARLIAEYEKETGEKFVESI